MIERKRKEKKKNWKRKKHGDVLRVLGRSPGGSFKEFLHGKKGGFERKKK